MCAYQFSAHHVLFTTLFHVTSFGLDDNSSGLVELILRYTTLLCTYALLLPLFGNPQVSSIKKACSPTKRNRLSLTNNEGNKAHPYFLISMFLRQPGHPLKDP